jgi:hypothetical protein
MVKGRTKALYQELVGLRALCRNMKAALLEGRFLSSITTQAARQCSTVVFDDCSRCVMKKTGLLENVHGLHESLKMFDDKYKQIMAESSALNILL